MKHVVVLGEGLTALAAAQRLRSAGLRVTRVAPEGFQSPSPGPSPRPRPRSTESELQLVPELHSALDWLDRSIEAPGRLSFARLSRVAVARSEGQSRIVSLSGRGLLGLGKGLGIVDGWRHARLRSLRSWFAPALDPATPELGIRLDDRSVADFARVYLARRETRSLLAAILEAGLGLDDRDLSRLLLFLRLDELGRLTLVRARGTERLEAALARANPPALRGTLAALAPGERGVKLLDGSSIEADGLVLCAAPADLRKQVAELPQRADAMLSRLSEGASWAVSMNIDRAISVPAGFWVCPRRLGGMLAGIVELEEGRILALGRPGLDRSADGDAKRIEEQLLQAARLALPRLRSARVETQAHRTLRSTFAPGHWRAVAAIGEEEARWLPSRRLALAGAWQVSPDAEGQARAGLRAAERLLSV